MEKYLLAESQRSAISLYVPETLGKCEYKGVAIPYAGKLPYGSFVASCMDYLKPFMDITRDDKWIGLLIWQHATAADHMKDDAFTVPSMYASEEYECAGCKESGEKRAEDEGKPYEDKVYAQSMKNGRKYMELAPGGRYEIHNAGRPGGMSVLWDRSVLGVGNRFSEIIRKAPGIQYVDARVTSQAGKETGRVLGEFMTERLAKNETAKAANALRSAAEGTQEAAAKRLAALRAPSQAEQNAATAEAKKLTAERRAENAKRLISEFDKTRGETHIERAARIATSAAKAAAKSKTRRNNAIARRADPSFRSKVAVADRAKAAEAARAAIAERAARAAETRVRNMPVAGERTVTSPIHSMFNRKVNNSQYQPNANPELAGLYQDPAAPFDNFSPVSLEQNPLYRPLGNALHRNAEQAPRQRGLFNAPENEDPAQPYNVSAFPSYRAPS
jgi:hypothetical protein